MIWACLTYSSGQNWSPLTTMKIGLLLFLSAAQPAFGEPVDMTAFQPFDWPPKVFWPSDTCCASKSKWALVTWLLKHCFYRRVPLVQIVPGRGWFRTCTLRWQFLVSSSLPSPGWPGSFEQWWPPFFTGTQLLILSGGEQEKDWGIIVRFTRTYIIPWQ